MKFLGYPENSAGYKVFDPLTHKVTIVRSPLFQEVARPTQNIPFESEASDDEEEPDKEIGSTDPMTSPFDNPWASPDVPTTPPNDSPPTPPPSCPT